MALSISLALGLSVIDCASRVCDSQTFDTDKIAHWERTSTGKRLIEPDKVPERHREVNFIRRSEGIDAELIL